MWLAQSFLLSFAIFFLFGEEFVLDRHEDFPCHKVIPAAANNSINRRNKDSECWKMEKSGKSQIIFGVLSVVQASLLSVVYGIRIRRKSPLPSLSVVCTACWALTSILLSTKLLTHFSPKIATHRITENGNYESTLFMLARDALIWILKTAFQRLWFFIPSRHSVIIRDKTNTFLHQKIQDGLYFCSSELNGQSFDQAGVNISRALAVTIVAYVLSSGYALCLVLGHHARSELILKPVDKCIWTPAQSEEGKDSKQGNLDEGKVGEGHTRSSEAANKKYVPRKGVHEFNKDMIVAFMDEESDEDSFVFGWRL